MDSNKKQKTSQEPKTKAAKSSKAKASTSKTENEPKESVGNEPENLSQSQEQDGLNEGRPRASSQKSAYICNEKVVYIGNRHD